MDAGGAIRLVDDVSHVEDQRDLAVAHDGCARNARHAPEVRLQALDDDLLLADQLLVGGVRAIAADRRVAVLCPLASQEPMTHEKWAPAVGPVEVASASPYGARTAVVEAAEKFASGDAEFVVLDCIGYDEDHRRGVREACGRPVLLARSLVGRLAAEVVA